MPTSTWDRASTALTAFEGRPRAEIAALPAGFPTVEALFTFMRDAEHRFTTLRMRIEERTATAVGERIVVVETLIAHPGRAKVTTTDPGLPPAEAYDVWASDGATVRTYDARHRLATNRAVRARVAGLDEAQLPGRSRVARPLTALPAETLPEAFVHPAGLCQNVLATGDCSVVGTTRVAGREAVVLGSDHPRGAEVWADRADRHVQVSVDRATGAILRLVEAIGGSITRDAVVTAFEPDAEIPAAAFQLFIPEGTKTIY